MVFDAIFLAVLCLSVVSCTSRKDCNEVQCKLILPAGEDLATEFQFKASEKGVRMVYLNLEIGNDSYNPLDVKDEFLPNRWVWARSVSEPMLSLSYDYDVLSLGILNYQVRRMNIPVEDHPSGCLAGLNSSCQDKVVGRALLTNVTKSSSGELSKKTDVVCVAVIENGNDSLPLFEANLNFYCCGKNRKASEEIICEQSVKTSGWLEAFIVILDMLTVVMVFYSPAFPLALPDFIFNFQEEVEKERRQEEEDLNERDSSEGSRRVDLRERNEYEPLDQTLVYLDDTSPITCSTILSKCIFNEYTLPNLRLSFNIKLAFLWYCIVPLFFYIKLGLSLTIKRKFFYEALRKKDAFLDGIFFSAFLVYFKTPFVMYSVTMFFAIPLVMILFLGPKDFLLSGMGSAQCGLCEGDTSSVGEEIRKHMEILPNALNDLAVKVLYVQSKPITKCIKSCTGLCEKQLRPPCKRLKRPFITLWVLFCNIIFAICFGMIWGAFCMFYTLLVLVAGIFLSSPFVALHYFLARKIAQLVIVLQHRVLRLRCVRSCLPFLVNYCAKVIATVSLFLCFILWILSFFFLSIACCIASLSCRLIGSVFGYLIMGFVLNADIASPFVTFFLVAATNLFLCYYNLQKRYKEITEMISKHWTENRLQELDVNINLLNSGQDAIPEGLFWHVCGIESISKHKVLPIVSEIWRMLRNMALILVFLFMALCSVIFFGKTYNVSAAVSTIAVLVSGAIPALFFGGLTKEKIFSGAKKHEMVIEIGKAVKEYVIMVRNSYPSSVSKDGVYVV